MKQLIQKTVTMLLITCILFSTFSFTAFASNDAKYRAILERINNEYGTNLGYCPVDSSKISISEYESATRKIAAEQKMLILSVGQT